ncbi:hypothetical protein KO361_02215 [Candidatus Woesearchaeota archaeon]|nr:hypothetical protein [Candidatus Woesearchaeota archaeon]
MNYGAQSLIHEKTYLKKFNLIYGKLNSKPDKVLKRYKSFLNYKTKSFCLLSLFDSDTQIKLNSIDDILTIRNIK